MITKNLIAAAVLLLTGSFTSNVNAQEESKLRLGAGIGINLNSISNNVGGSSKIGFNLGMKADYFFNKQIYFASGLFFTQKNAGSVMAGEHDKEIYTTTEKWNYLEVPLHIGYRYEIVDGVAFFGEVGPYIAVAVSAKEKVGGKSYNLFSKNALDTDYKAKRFNAGIGIHAGMDFGRLQGRLGYDFGLTKLYGLQGMPSQKHGTFTVGAAYFF